MSSRALEFVETWVSGKIEETGKLPAEGDEAAAKAWANECFQAAPDEDIPAAEIQEAFDNLAEFIAGEIEEERERRDRDRGRRQIRGDGVRRGHGLINTRPMSDFLG
jgi:hypothetical protein